MPIRDLKDSWKQQDQKTKHLVHHYYDFHGNFLLLVKRLSLKQYFAEWTPSAFVLLCFKDLFVLKGTDIVQRYYQKAQKFLPFSSPARVSIRADTKSFLLPFTETPILLQDHCKKKISNRANQLLTMDEVCRPDEVQT
jgi:hypothetical protein